MTTEFTLQLVLKSDATFGRGDGVAGLVDAEVQHDEYGFPYIGGRTLKGLLVEECANLIFALSQMGKDEAWLHNWICAADRLFGIAGSSVDGFARLRVGPAQLSAPLRAVATQEFVGKTPEEMRTVMLPALTAVRRQTAVDPATGAPKQETLRTVRVILRETIFQASLRIDPPAHEDENTDEATITALYSRMIGLLAATVLALRRGGMDRNRGRGELTAQLLDRAGTNVTDSYFRDYFVKEVQA